MIVGVVVVVGMIVVVVREPRRGVRFDTVGGIRQAITTPSNDCKGYCGSEHSTCNNDEDGKRFHYVSLCSWQLWLSNLTQNI